MIIDIFITNCLIFDMKFLVIIWALCLLTRQSYGIMYKKVSDSLLSGILQDLSDQTEPVYFLLSINKSEESRLSKQVKDLNDISKKLPTLIIYHGSIDENRQLQRQFHIKRYPYFGCLLFNKAHPLYFGMPDIVTQKTISSFIIKTYKYWKYITIKDPKHLQFPISKFYPFKVNIPYQMIPSKKMLEKLLFNKIYYIVDIQLSTEGFSAQDLRLCSKQSEQCPVLALNLTNYQALIDVMNNLALSGINQFGQQIYGVIPPSASKIFMVVLDSINDRNDSWMYRQKLQQKITKDILGNLKSVNSRLDKDKKVGSDYYVFWLESSLNPQKKQYLGFHESAQPPLVAQFILHDPQRKNYLSETNSKSIEKVLRFISRTVNQNKQKELFDEFIYAVNKSPLQFRIPIYQYSQQGDEFKSLEQKEAKKLSEIDNTIVFAIKQPYLTQNFWHQCYLDHQPIINQITSILYLMSRLNRFTAIHSYLETRHQSLYSLILVINYPNLQKCTEIFIHQNNRQISAASQINTQTITQKVSSDISINQIFMYLSEKHKLPPQWSILQSEIKRQIMDYSYSSHDYH